MSLSRISLVESIDFFSVMMSIHYMEVSLAVISGLLCCYSK